MTSAPNATPAPSIQGQAGSAGDEPFPWDALVSRFMHPVQVAMVEALIRIGRPIAPSDLCHMYGGGLSVANVGYHAKTLAELGVIELVETEPVRGAMRHLYVLAPASKWQ